MSNSLIPERPLIVSPSLAATIGLEAALLLQHLEQCIELSSTAGHANLDPQYQWQQSSLATLANQLPFWDAAVLRRIMQELIDLGMLQISDFPTSQQQLFSFAINQKVAQSPQPIHNTQNNNLGAYKIPANWRPDSDIMLKLADKGIDEVFIHNSIEEFVLYWRERNEVAHAWSNRFMQHVSRSWEIERERRNQRLQSSLSASTTKARTSKAMHECWQPSEDAIEILQRMGIARNFIEDAVAEFILYWQERGEAQSTWNSKFVSHVKRQWASYTHALKHDTEPRPINTNWRPDTEVYDILTLANINQDFAEKLIPEFILYWRDSNELHHSWNTRFLQYVKRQWSKSHFSENENNHEKSGQNVTKRKTRDRSLVEDLTDRSWAS